MAEKKNSDAITNKVLAVISVCLAGVIVLMGINNLQSHGDSYRTGVIVTQILLGLTGLCAVGGLIKLFGRHEEGSNKVLSAVSMTVFGLVGAAVMLTVLLYGISIIPLYYILLPVLAVYYLIYYSYQSEFFVIALDCGAAIGLLAVIRRALGGGNYAYLAMVAAALMVVIAVMQLVAVSAMRKNRGKLKLGRKKITYDFHRNAYLMMSITPVLMAALTVVGAIAGEAFALIAIGVAAVYVFVAAVYYTVKLM